MIKNKEKLTASQEAPRLLFFDYIPVTDFFYDLSQFLRKHLKTSLRNHLKNSDVTKLNILSQFSKIWRSRHYLSHRISIPSGVDGDLSETEPDFNIN